MPAFGQRRSHPAPAAPPSTFDGVHLWDMLNAVPSGGNAGTVPDSVGSQDLPYTNCALVADGLDFLGITSRIGGIALNTMNLAIDLADDQVPYTFIFSTDLRVQNYDRFYCVSDSIERPIAQYGTSPSGGSIAFYTNHTNNSTQTMFTVFSDPADHYYDFIFIRNPGPANSDIIVTEDFVEKNRGSFPVATTTVGTVSGSTEFSLGNGANIDRGMEGVARWAAYWDYNMTPEEAISQVVAGRPSA